MLKESFFSYIVHHEVPGEYKLSTSSLIRLHPVIRSPYLEFGSMEGL